MKIYVIRHGETGANEEGRLQGWLDEPLNDLGIKLAVETGEALKGIKFAAAFSSPLIRARKTAELLLSNSGNGDTKITIDNRLKEIHMGTWEGKYIKGDKCEVPKEKIKAFFANPFQCGTMPEGENADQVCARTQEFFRELIRKDIDGTVLVSTHGFAMRALLNPLYDNRSDFWQGHVPYNCAVNIVEVQNGQCHLVGDEKIYYDKSQTYDRYIKLKA